MADGYARASGKPAACFIISGPGMTNIMTAMAQAYSDSVPMLVISSVNNSFELSLGQGRLHELPNQRQVTDGVSVFSHTLNRPEELPEVMDRAFAVFQSTRPGPVHIEIPLDVIMAAAPMHADTDVHKKYKPGPYVEAIKSAASLLKQATHPFIVLGGGTQGAALEARSLVGKIGAPTALTINAKGVLPGGHPCSLGSRLPQTPVMDELQAADVVLAIGTELGETDTLLFDDRLRLSGKLVRIDIEAEQLTRNALSTVGICADAGLAMAALSNELADKPLNDCKDAVEKLRDLADAELPASYHLHGRFMDRIAAALPGVVIVGDSTQPVYGGNFLYEPSDPRSYFNSSTGYGTLGYGLSAALGAKLACPERPVVCVIGDGGFQFTLGELATAVELELSVPILLWNNQGYGEIKKYMLERGIPTIGVDIYTPNFQMIAKGFGCHSSVAESFDHLRDLLVKANGSNVPTLIEINDSDIHQW